MIFLSFLFLESRKVVHYVSCHECHEGERGERKGKKSVNKFHPSKLRHWFILFPSSYRQTDTIVFWKTTAESFLYQTPPPYAVCISCSFRSSIGYLRPLFSLFFLQLESWSSFSYPSPRAMREEREETPTVFSRRKRDPGTCEFR